MSTGLPFFVFVFLFRVPQAECRGVACASACGGVSARACFTSDPIQAALILKLKPGWACFSGACLSFFVDLGFRARMCLFLVLRVHLVAVRHLRLRVLALMIQEALII